MIDDDAEQLLLPVARQPLKDVLMIIRDMGIRPEESFWMRKQHIDLERRRYVALGSATMESHSIEWHRWFGGDGIQLHGGQRRTP